MSNHNQIPAEVDHKKSYASVSWHIEDIQDLRPEWTDQQAEEWLRNNEKHIRHRLVELGWEVIEDLLPLRQKPDAPRG